MEKVLNFALLTAPNALMYFKFLNDNSFDQRFL